MATVTGSLSDNGLSDVLHLRNQVEQVAYSVTGTHDGVLTLERAKTPAMSAWEILKSSSGGLLSGVYQSRPNDHLRFRVQGAVSVSLDYSLADGDAIRREDRNAENEVTETVTQAGRSINGTLAVSGNTSIGGALSLSGAATFGSNVFKTQAAPAAKTTDATLTASELLAGLITGNQGAAGGAAYTLPLGTDMEAARTWAASDSFEFTVINLSTVDAEDITMTAATGFTIVGNAVIHARSANTLQTSGTFIVRRSAADTFVAYRK
jgi:hypothetical protein